MSRVGKYELGNTLGKGAYAKVKKAVNIENGNTYAIKILQKSPELDFAEGLPKEVYKEVGILRNLKHRNIIKLHEILVSQAHLYIVLDYVDGGELFSYVQAKGRLEEAEAAFIFQQLIDGIDYCHSLGIVHRDLKFENLLLSDGGILKIGDFGLSGLCGDDGVMHTQCGTLEYTAPEILNMKEETTNSQGYDGTKTDCWACGIILFGMVTGHLPFQDDNRGVVRKYILSRNFDYPDFMSTSLRDLLDNMICLNPNLRWPLAKVRDHPWFKMNYKQNRAMLEKFFLNKTPLLASDGALFEHIKTPRLVEEDLYKDINNEIVAVRQVDEVFKQDDLESLKDLYKRLSLDTNENVKVPENQRIPKVKAMDMKKITPKVKPLDLEPVENLKSPNNNSKSPINTRPSQITKSPGKSFIKIKSVERLEKGGSFINMKSFDKLEKGGSFINMKSFDKLEKGKSLGNIKVEKENMNLDTFKEKEEVLESLDRANIRFSPELVYITEDILEAPEAESANVKNLGFMKSISKWIKNKDNNEAPHLPTFTRNHSRTTTITTTTTNNNNYNNNDNNNNNNSKKSPSRATSLILYLVAGEEAGESPTRNFSRLSRMTLTRESSEKSGDVAGVGCFEDTLPNRGAVASKPKAQERVFPGRESELGRIKIRKSGMRSSASQLPSRSQSTNNGGGSANDLHHHFHRKYSSKSQSSSTSVRGFIGRVFLGAPQSITFLLGLPLSKARAIVSQGFEALGCGVVLKGNKSKFKCSFPGVKSKAEKVFVSCELIEKRENVTEVSCYLGKKSLMSKGNEEMIHEDFYDFALAVERYVKGRLIEMEEDEEE